MIEELTQEPNVTFAYLETVDQQLGGLSALEDCQQVSFLLATVQSLDMVYRKGSSGYTPKIAVVLRNRAGHRHTTQVIITPTTPMSNSASGKPPAVIISSMSSLLFTNCILQ